MQIPNPNLPLRKQNTKCKYINSQFQTFVFCIEYRALKTVFRDMSRFLVFGAL